MYLTRLLTSSLKARLEIGDWRLEKLKTPILYSLFSILLLLSATACGFKPIHAKMNHGLASELASVQVSDIKGRQGQVLKYKLLELLNPDSGSPSPQYRLDIALEETRTELGIQE